MSDNSGEINLRVTFIGAVEHIQQIEEGIKSFLGVKDIVWTQSADDNTVHLDMTRIPREFDDSSPSGSFVDEIFKSLAIYFASRAIIEEEDVQKIGIEPFETLRKNGSNFYAHNLPIDVQPTGRTITDGEGVERAHAVVVLDSGSANQCRLARNYDICPA